MDAIGLVANRFGSHLIFKTFLTPSGPNKSGKPDTTGRRGDEPTWFSQLGVCEARFLGLP